ncbi:RusA family crossover junction endodeoxyribonuclease [Nonomuraea sp. NPDC050663]|uniref:RusA family crossover junction endodeoxyribonuclease n=1 Tax=Nonomuraea sp. NPDC050663 TaxID=3364370 RepID=UPI00379F0C9A
MTEPEITITVYGKPAPQGSKRHVGNGRMIEQVKGVKPWRASVVRDATAQLRALSVQRYGGVGQVSMLRLDGQLEASMAFTMRAKPTSKPSWWPPSEPWSRHLWWYPASRPDLSKLVRSTEDALTDAGVWADDGRVVRYRDVVEMYVGDPREPHALDQPGAVIRIWKVAAP